MSTFHPLGTLPRSPAEYRSLFTAESELPAEEGESDGAGPALEPWHTGVSRWELVALTSSNSRHGYHLHKGEATELDLVKQEGRRSNRVGPAPRTRNIYLR